jgi:transposase
MTSRLQRAAPSVSRDLTEASRFPNRHFFDSWQTGIREPVMLTKMTEEDWEIVLEVFDAAQWERGEPGHGDRKFLEALLYFTVHSITWRALPAEFGNWNSIWKRFWRLSRSGVFEAFLQLLAETSKTAHVVQFFDSTVVRARMSPPQAQKGAGKSGTRPFEGWVVLKDPSQDRL